MTRTRLLIIAAAVAILLAPSVADAAKKHRPRHVVRHWHGYGFLPGYPPAPERPLAPTSYWYGRPGWYGGPGWYGAPGWYRGRFTNGLGPCWTRTPIGPMWNCGR
jgi:hypothetical protein